MSVPANLVNCCFLIDRLLLSLITSASTVGPSRGDAGFLQAFDLKAVCFAEKKLKYEICFS